MSEQITIGFSPCPNDTFIFDALVNKKIDTGGIKFLPVLEDVQTLNEWALEGKLHCTKLSFPAFFQSLPKYRLLNAGSALGKGVGPLLISRSADKLKPSQIEKANIAIPGMNTTANLLLSFAFPGARNKMPVLFSAIEDFVLGGKAELGVIIHENRFTYQDKGLHLQTDLGAYWEFQTGLPVPLGGIAIRNDIDQARAKKIDRLIRASLEFANEKYPEVTGYVRSHAQAMDEKVMLQHINLYVNEFSLQLGPEGKYAIERMYQIFQSIHEDSATARSTSELFIGG